MEIVAVRSEAVSLFAIAELGIAECATARDGTDDPLGAICHRLEQCDRGSNVSQLHIETGAALLGTVENPFEMKTGAVPRSGTLVRSPIRFVSGAELMIG